MEGILALHSSLPKIRPLFSVTSKNVLGHNEGNAQCSNYFIEVL